MPGQPVIAQGREFRVNTHTQDDQQEPAVTALTGGGFVVTWHSEGQDGSEYGVYGQRYDAAGNATGGEFQVNTYTSSWQEICPKVGDGRHQAAI